MRHTQRTILCMLLACFSISSFAVSPKYEFRATWLTTVMSIDWPKLRITNPNSEKQRARQQQGLLDILDALETANMNAACFQVRGLCDAMYKSSYEPWSDVLTSTRGKNPGYDPLAYFVEVAHARGIEVHVWVNPFRYESTGYMHGAEDPIRKNHPEWILSYNNASFKGTILDPGQPEVREYTVKVIREIVENYDIDGVIFDDYFYPYGGTTNEDIDSQKKYKPYSKNVQDWRRENIDMTMKAVYDMIQTTKPWVRFGIAPFGIWSTSASAASKYGVTLPEGIRGTNAYEVLCCNTLEWMKGGYVDYIAPQIYWPTTSTAQSYAKLVHWWNEMSEVFTKQLSGGQKIHFFSSQSTYESWCSTKEMGLEIDYNRKYDRLGAPGSIFYNTTNFVSKGMPAYLGEKKFTDASLPPAMDWKKATTLSAPTDLQVTDSILSWKHSSAPRFTIYAIPEGVDSVKALEKADYLLGVSYTSSFNISEVTGMETVRFAVRAYDRYGNEYAPAYCRATFTGVEDVLTPAIVLAPTFEGVQIDFEGEQMLEIYTANGMLIHRAIAQGTYSYPLSQGVYLIRVGNIVRKFIR